MKKKVILIVAIIIIIISILIGILYSFVFSKKNNRDAKENTQEVNISEEIKVQKESPKIFSRK